MDRNEQNLERLTKIHEMGMSCFVIKRGIIGWGLSFGVLASIGLYCGLGLPEEVVMPANMLLIAVLFAFALSVLGGALWGYLMWNFFERRYERTKNA